ncbi:hypothetical protein [Occallatibacter riparius]|uniref:Uncharacterized protein n=1 Tax=Occallatibacter riparius TaxID=1002689 RepID=A0A9J7BXY8_9BACT|nr:hypothetical protein [Occallatibacter riparius]UWZ86898.1 hypothetical protein MOP44_13335 [Occallatibacter riparius]
MRNIISGLLKLRLLSGAGWTRVRLSRMLLALVAVCVLSSPITQRLWAWDGFLHGGQDFETGALLILLSLCLVLVLVRVCKSAFERMLAGLSGRAFMCRTAAELAPLRVALAILPLGWDAHAVFSLPLQI